jgi:hypothetical protein
VLYVFLVVLGLLGVAAYLLVIFREVPGAVEERLGTLDELPEHVGQWHSDEESALGRAALDIGERREVRLWCQHGGGWFGSQRLYEQARYRNLANDEIVRSDPDRVIKRKRRRKPSA